MAKTQPSKRPEKSKKQGRRKGGKILAAAVRDARGMFVKGSTGNPGGRPTAAIEVRELARAHGPECIDKLLEWMRHGDAQSSIAAAKILLDRGFGKAIQHVAGNGSTPAINLNFGARPIVTAEQAMAAYQMIMGDPTIDTSQLQFSPVTKEESDK